MNCLKIIYLRDILIYKGALDKSLNLFCYEPGAWWNLWLPQQEPCYDLKLMA
jgi:hypothetical protein